MDLRFPFVVDKPIFHRLDVGHFGVIIMQNDSTRLSVVIPAYILKKIPALS